MLSKKQDKKPSPHFPSSKKNNLPKNRRLEKNIFVEIQKSIDILENNVILHSTTMFNHRDLR